MKSSERGWVRGAVVIGIAGTMMAVALLSPALAVKLATTSYVKQKVNQAFNQTFSFFLQTPILAFRSDPIAVAPGVAQFAAVPCPPGGVATGGGASGASVAEDWDLETSYPSNGATAGAGATGWAVVMKNESTAPLNFRVYVLCGGGSSATNFTPGSTPARATDAGWPPAPGVKPTVVTRALPR
jgi:hypothetical protein